MNLIKINDHYLIFQFTPGQKVVFERLLAKYPVSAKSFHTISRTGKEADLEEQQEMLDEALAATRRDNRRQLSNFLREPGRFEQFENNWHLKILPRHLTMLMQVFNEIRVGYWYQLDCPTEEDLPEFSSANAEIILFMELCGHYQMVLLNAQVDT